MQFIKVFTFLLIVVLYYVDSLTSDLRNVSETGLLGSDLKQLHEKLKSIPDDVKPYHEIGYFVTLNDSKIVNYQFIKNYYLIQNALAPVLVYPSTDCHYVLGYHYLSKTDHDEYANTILLKHKTIDTEIILYKNTGL